METKFNFASFDWPRYYAILPKGSLAKRVSARKNRFTSGYYGAPKPGATGASFYLNSDFMPGLRWQWCDDIARRIRHQGWYTNVDGYGDTIRGIVFRLPHGRGFLAGWSMGKGMIGGVDYYIYPDELGAALAADGMAEHIAEKEREYQEEQDRAEQELDELINSEG